VSRALGGRGMCAGRRAAAGRAAGLRCVWESQPGGHGGDFQGAPLSAAVPAVTLDVSGRDLAPGQAGELSVQAGLVALDGQDVARAALGRQVLGVGALGVHRIRVW